MSAKEISPLELYRSCLEGVEAHQDRDDSWFVATLAKSRSGDEAASRELAGGFLRLGCLLAEEYGTDFNETELFDAIQETNNALMLAIESFQGNDAVGFTEHFSRIARIHLGLSMKRRP